MHFETALIDIRLALVECKTLLNSWDAVANTEWSVAVDATVTLTQD